MNYRPDRAYLASLLEIAELYGVSLSTIGRYAAEDGWTPVPGTTRRYDLAEVSAGLQRRADAEKLAGQHRQQVGALKRMGLTPDEFDALSKVQGGACAICGQVPEDQRLSVDHDHDCCGKGRACKRCIRGLLCRGCNTGLGAFQDDWVLMTRAAGYLQRRRPFSPLTNPE